MPGWDTLDDDPIVPAAGAANGSRSWASLDDDEAAVESSPVVPETGGAWADLDHVGAPPPPAEFAAAELTDGEVVWAQVSGSDVVLGSGRSLFVPKGVPDGLTGWRRVRVLDAASLHAEVIELKLAAPTRQVGDDPELVWQPPPRAPGVDRVPAFPVGQGGDLSALFDAKLREQKQQLDIAAAEESGRVTARLRTAERQADDRVRSVEQKAEQAVATARDEVRGAQREAEQARTNAEEKIRRAQREADDRVGNAAARIREEAGRAVAAAETQAAERIVVIRAEQSVLAAQLESAKRDAQLRLTAAVLGWGGLVLVVVILLAGV